MLTAKLHLVGLSHFLQLLQRLRRGQLKLLQGNPILDDFLHLRFDFHQLVGGKGLFHVKVVVKAVVDGGADGQLYIRVQPLYRLSQDMGGSVPECLFALHGVKGHHLEAAVRSQHCPQILHLSVDLHAACRLVKPHADTLDDFCCGLPRFRLTDAAVLECKFNHDYPSFPVYKFG